MGEILWRVTVQGFALTIFLVLLQDGSGGGRAGGGRRLRKRRRATWSEEGSEGEDADGEEVSSCAGVLGVCCQGLGSHTQKAFGCQARKSIALMTSMIESLL